MNFDALFRDYEARLAAQRFSEVELSAAEQKIAEFSKISVADRLAGQLGQTLFVATSDDQLWEGVLESIGLGWLQLRSQRGAILLPLSALMWWEGGNAFSDADASTVARKLSFGFALRALVRYRAKVNIFLPSRQEVTGVISRVGADFLEVKTHPAQRPDIREKQNYRMIPFAWISAVVIPDVYA